MPCNELEMSDLEDCDERKCNSQSDSAVDTEGDEHQGHSAYNDYTFK